jgi:putative endonuclease
VARRRAGWHVYLLRCGDGSLYTGATNDLARRLSRHAAGQGARYTRSRLPVVLVHSERARDRGAALRREAAIKRLTRPAKLELVAAGRRDRRSPRA